MGRFCVCSCTWRCFTPELVATYLTLYNPVWEGEEVAVSRLPVSMGCKSSSHSSPPVRRLFRNLSRACTRTSISTPARTVPWMALLSQLRPGPYAMVFGSEISPGRICTTKGDPEMLTSSAPTVTR